MNYKVWTKFTFASQFLHWHPPDWNLPINLWSLFLSIVQNHRWKVLHTCAVTLIKYRYFGMSINCPDKLSQNIATENQESSLAFFRRKYFTFYKQQINFKNIIVRTLLLLFRSGILLSALLRHKCCFS